MTMNNGIGSISFEVSPNSDIVEKLVGKSGVLACEVEEFNVVVWKYSRGVMFYPFTECSYDGDKGIITKISYRLVQDNKIDNLVNMLGDMKATVSAYKNELVSVNVSGLMITRIEELLDRLDQDEEKLKDFKNLYQTTRKRLISDYGIGESDTKEKF
jgi:hypothetical protein